MFLPVPEGCGMVVGEQDSDYGTGGMLNGIAGLIPLAGRKEVGGLPSKSDFQVCG